MRSRFIAIVLCFSLVSSMLFGVQNAKATVPVIDGANTTSSIWNGIQAAFTAVSTGGSLLTELAKIAKAIGASNMVAAAKVLALIGIQKSVAAMIGGGDNKGGGLVIRDFNEYLYVAPQQKAMAQMNSFFNTVSKGRLSTLNYEGVGPNYDAYLVAQARQSMSGQVFKTNLQEQVTDPTRLFSNGNMRGIMTYMQCANNPACYTLTSTARYNAEVAKAQKIAEIEQSGGLRPQKVNGRITKPSALAQNALSQVDQLGTQVIMNADAKDMSGLSAALWQIGEGAAMTIAARLTNYGLSDDAGKAAIRNKNDQFPFSLSYTANTGVGFTAGGVTVKTGMGAMASQVQIGNTCATTFGSVTPAGAQVTIDGKKYTCPKPGTKVSGEAPSILCTTDSACNIGTAAGTYICRQGKCMKR